MNGGTYDLEQLLARLAQAGVRASGIAEDLDQSFLRVARLVATAASRVSDAEARADVRGVPAIDLHEAVAKLRAHGAAALSNRERRSLVASPNCLEPGEIDELLRCSPHLAQRALATCLARWPNYLKEAWGTSYRTALLSHWSTLDLPVLSRSALSLHELLDRGKETAGHVRIAGTLQGRSIEEGHRYLRDHLGVRDSWLLMPCILLECIAMTDSARRSDRVLEVLDDSRLRTLMLPALRDGTPESGATVRRDAALQPRIAASFLVAAIRAADYGSKVVLERLVNHLLASEFGDPRTPVPSSAWTAVREHDPQAYHRLLSMLAEQDLDVFFSHAMNEPDRRAFWLRYLGAIERTGCVLDKSVRARLHARLAATPGLRGAIDRAFGFSRASNVQAFFLVFREFVVIEFSDRGNAAYVYPRSYFSSALEPMLSKSMIESAAELKDRGRVKHRLLHHSNWQEAASNWLAEHGVHDRRRSLLL